MDSSTDCCPSSPCLNESPPKKEGKYRSSPSLNSLFGASMKALPKRKGNKSFIKSACEIAAASMKALPERKGNLRICIRLTGCKRCLNESLSGKDGKYSPPRPRICQKTRLNESPSKKERKSELPPVSWTTKLKSKKQEAFHVYKSGNETRSFASETGSANV